MAVTLRILLAVLVFAVPGASRDARAGGISDIVSDFLYLQEDLKVKAPARPVAEVVTGVGERFLGLVDAEGVVRVWDFETGGQLMVEGRRPAAVRALFPSARGANLIVVEATGRVYETAGMSWASKAMLLPSGSAADAFAVSPRAPVLAAAGGGTLRVHNLATRRTAEVPLAERVTALTVSDDGRFVAWESASAAGVIDADRQAPVARLPGAGRPRFYANATGGLGLARHDAPARLTLYQLDGQGFAKAGEHAFGGPPDQVWISGAQVHWTTRLTLHAAPIGGRGKKVLEAKDPIVHVRPVKGGDDLLVVYQSGLMTVLSGKTGKVTVTAMSTENGWAVVDAAKRYDGSLSGGREIAWVVQKVDLDLEKFARHFYEPGLLLHYIAPQPLPFSSTGHQGAFPGPPTIADVKLLENVAGSGQTVVLATARNIKDEVSGLEIYHNGKRVPDTARITEESTRKDDLRFRSAGYRIHPVPGSNTVAVVGLGRLGIEGPTRDLTFTRPGEASGALHVIVVGIERYAAPSLRLGYARRDAEAIARLMRGSKGFEKINVTELYDANAGRDVVLGAIRAAATAAAPGDTIVLYLAGHGIAIKGAWYFLSPAVAEVEEAEIVTLSTAAEQIAAILKESRASRVVLMIDSCNSGAVVKDIKGLLQNRVYTQLGRRTGFAVLAAARQDQAALERASLGHGVFTAATVAALTGAADRNADGRVTARELAAYLARQIPTLATEHLNEIQIPVAYAPSEDFVVRSLR